VTINPDGSLGADDPKGIAKQKIRAIACSSHEWFDVFDKPKRDALLSQEYENYGWSEYQRCRLCQRIGQKRVEWYTGEGKVYAADLKVFTLRDSLRMMSRTVHPWNERVKKSESHRAISLILSDGEVRGSSDG
jgi:hypothetical protein